MVFGDARRRGKLCAGLGFRGTPQKRQISLFRGCFSVLFLGYQDPRFERVPLKKGEKEVKTTKNSEKQRFWGFPETVYSYGPIVGFHGGFWRFLALF